MSTLTFGLEINIKADDVDHLVGVTPRMHFISDVIIVIQISLLSTDE
jgi:hypothetical protein